MVSIKNEDNKNMKKNQQPRMTGNLEETENRTFVVFSCFCGETDVLLNKNPSSHLFIPHRKLQNIPW